MRFGFYARDLAHERVAAVGADDEAGFDFFAVFGYGADFAGESDEMTALCLNM